MSVEDGAAREFLSRMCEHAPEALRTLAPDRDDLRDKLTTYLNEAPVALELLTPLLTHDRPLRILEVGSGIGAVSACLAADGHQVVAIEPAGPGFDDMVLLQRAIDDAVGCSGGSAPGSRTTLTIGVDDLDPAVHGLFDVAFSANVLEHVPDPVAALDRIQAVLEPRGVQRHVCPNYAFPYEPHFFVPLLPLRPSATRRLLPRRITGTGLWASLNFITARRVRRWARRSDVALSFDRGVLAEAVQRFLSDPVFAERHSRLGRVVRWMDRVRIVPVLRRLPASAVSPMRFSVTALPGERSTS